MRRRLAPWLCALALAGCGVGQVDAPFAQAVPGNADVSLISYQAHITSGLSDEVRITLPENVGSALIEVRGDHGDFHLAELMGPDGTDVVENGGFITRDARETSGLVDWLYPNTPALVARPGEYKLRFSALDGDQAIDDMDTEVRVYSRPPAPTHAGKIHLDLFVVDGAITDQDPSSAVDALVARIGSIYAQAAIQIADYTFTELHLSSPDVSLDGSQPGLSPFDVTAMVRKTARPNAVHLVVVRSLENGSGLVAGYSLGLPGPFDPDRPNSAVLVAAGPFSSPTSGALDLTGLSVTCAHEIGHYLGLYHTSERDGAAHDPIPDTPECAPTQVPCPDADNIMFWTGGATRSVLSAGQAYVMKLHPLCEPLADAPPATANCSPACSGGQTCVLVSGQSVCETACDPKGAPCPQGSACAPADDGTYVCGGLR